MFWDILLLIIGLLLLAFGGEGLIRGSSALAVRLGLTPLVVGLTVVAFGTSAPELVVSTGAALSDNDGIAVGNVVGSNILNIGLVLGVASLLSPVRVKLQVLKYDAPIMTAASILTLILLKVGMIYLVHGLLFLALLIGYIIFTVFVARRQIYPEVECEYQEGIPCRSKSLGLDILFIIGSLLLLVFGARLMVASAADIARLLGVSEAVIGLTIVAIGTSMPELTTSVLAALRHQSDIAVGNVIGSNIFNIFGILGAASIIKPLTRSGITDLDLWVMVIFSIALLPLLYTGLKLRRWEGGLLLMAYGAYLWALWP